MTGEERMEVLIDLLAEIWTETCLEEVKRKVGDAVTR